MLNHIQKHSITSIPLKRGLQKMSLRGIHSVHNSPPNYEHIFLLLITENREHTFEDMVKESVSLSFFWIAYFQKNKCPEAKT